MNREESIKLLALIKVAYPTAYKDMDSVSKQATVNMWQTTFQTIPYPIMEMAFNRFRIASKFPPTVAEMCVELQHLYWKAKEDMLVFSALGKTDDIPTYEWIAEHTSAYRNDGYKDMPILSSVNALAGNVDIKRLSNGEDDVL